MQNKNRNGFLKKLQKEIFAKQLVTPVGLTFLGLIAVFFGFLASKNMVVISFAIIGLLIAAFIVNLCIFKPIKGYYLVILLAFFADYPSRILHVALPIFTFIEILILFLFIGVIWAGKSDTNQKGNLLASPVAVVFFITYLYFFLEFFNPNMISVGGYFFGFKRVIVFLLFFILTYKLINTPERFKYFFKFWLVISFITALYGCTQQWIGYIPFEYAWVKKDPHEFALLFQGGVIRKFSFLDGVVTFGVLSGSMAVIALILAMNEPKKSRKWKLYVMAVVCFLGMAYSGTRTFTIMMPVGIALYILITIKNKATLITLFVTFMAFLFVFFAPIDNPTLNRMRSTFDSEDESLNVRNVNRNSIQPYIYAHPFGGGIATTGVEGMRWSPSHPLAGFPPDSGLLMFALEIGWVGLSLQIIFYLTMLYQGIYYYFRMKSKKYKKYILAIIAGFLAILVTLYSQASVGQMPNIFFFYGCIALFKRLWEFDKAEAEKRLQFSEV